MIRTDLGAVTAYAYAVSKGYTGTEEQFATDMAALENNASKINTLYPADTTLTTSGKAADAKKTGDEITDLKEDFSDVSEWLGYAVNLFDARKISVSNATNWEITSATRTSISINHKNTFATGMPAVEVDLPTGDYVFNADYTDSAATFSLRVNGSWIKELTNGAEFSIDSTDTNVIYLSSSSAGTFAITDISVVRKGTSGEITEIDSAIDELTEKMDACESKIENLQDEFSDITAPVTSIMEGTEVQDKTINASGQVITAGNTSYRVITYSIVGGKPYYITAATNWKNLFWCFYDDNDNVIQTGTASAAGSAFSSIVDEEVIAPTQATVLKITYNTTVLTGACKTVTGYTLGGQWTGKKWVCVGDSLTAVNEKATKRYFDYVRDKTGITTVNMGYSGSGYARLSDENQAFYQRISSCPTDADVVTIFGSFNDLGAGLSIGSVDDTGTTTLAGCINTTIDNLQSVIPLVNLGIVAPTPWDTTQPSTAGNAYNYVEMLKAICERRSIPFLDLWRCSNLRPWDADFRTLAYSRDGGSGTHPDETGHKIIAPRFKAFLETLLL